MTETYAEVARADDIARCWPDGREMPPLIGKVADYLASQIWLSLGATRMIGDRMDDHWTENGADLWADFGCFMRLPEGSRVAQWFGDGDDGEPPIVLIGSQGETAVLAEDLSSFLAAWARAEIDEDGELVVRCPAGVVKVVLPYDLETREAESEDEDEVVDGRPPFATVLKDLLGADLCGVLKPKPDDAPFEQFFEAWGETQRAEIASNPNLRTIAEILDAFIPRGKQPWERAHFRVSAIDDRIEIGSKGDPRKLLEPGLADRIRPLIKAERERRAAGANAPRGLWYTGHLMLYPDGICRLACDWESKPKFFHGPTAAAAELVQELKRFPKTDRWKMDWMDDLP